MTLNLAFTVLQGRNAGSVRWCLTADYGAIEQVQVSVEQFMWHPAWNKKKKKKASVSRRSFSAIFTLLFSRFRGSPQRMTLKIQVRRFQDIAHPVCQPLCQSLSHKYSLLVASNSVTAGFGSSSTSNLKWRRKTTEWSTTAVKWQQHASCILIPARGNRELEAKVNLPYPNILLRHEKKHKSFTHPEAI